MAFRIPKLKAWQWVLLFLGAVAGAVGAFFLLKVVSIHDMTERIRELGPLPFFFALAILPALGAPITPFYLVAGSSFGIKAAIPLVLTGLAANMALSYIMARWILRPLIVRIVERLGYKIPVIRTEDRWSIAFLVRVTPGPPFPVQNYVLGLAGVPFGIYMIVSVLVASFFAVGMTWFGDSLMRGESGMLVAGVCMLVAAFLAVRLVRRMVQRKAGQVVANVE